MRAERRLLVLTLLGCAIALGAGLASWLFSHVERRVERIVLPPSHEAQRNPLLAAERFLDRLEIPTVALASGASLCRLPPPVDTLILSEPRPPCPGREADLRDWIAAGGRLVTRARTEEETGPDLLAGLGVVAKSRAITANQGPVAIRPGLKAPVFLVDPTGRILTENAKNKGDIDASDTPFLQRFGLGDGELLVLASLDFMHNDAIGEQDHARFTAWLATPRDRAGRVWLIGHAGEQARLPALLWALAPEALISAALLLLLWLWSLGARLGPLEAPPSRQRRDLLEHLEASAAFLWRQGQFARLAHASRQGLRRRWTRQLAPDARTGSKEWIQALAEASGTPPESLARALHGVLDSPGACLEQARTLQRLWRLAQRGQPAPPAQLPARDDRHD